MVVAGIITNSLKKPHQDHGWAWLVLFGAYFMYLLVGGLERSFTLIYIEIREYFGTTSASTSMIGGINTSLRLLLGPFAVALCQNFGIQKTAMVGGLIVTVSYVGLAFCTNYIFMFVLYGFLSGVGMSITFTSGLLAINEYFLDRRSLAMAICSSGAGVGIFCTVPLVDYLIEEFTFPRAFLAIACINAQLIVCGSFYFAPIITKKESLQNELEIDPLEITLIPKEENIEEVDKAPEPTWLCKIWRRSRFGDILSDAEMVIFLLGSSIFVISPKPFLQFITDFSRNKGVSHHLTLYIITVDGVATIFSRFALGSFLGLAKVAPYRPLIWTLSHGASAIVCMTASAASSFAAFMTLSVLWSIFFGIIISQQMVVLGDLVDPDLLPPAIGLFQFVRGIGLLIGFPFGGWLRDISGGYELCYLVVGAVSALGFLIILFIVIKRTRQIKRLQLEKGEMQAEQLEEEELLAQNDCAK